MIKQDIEVWKEELRSCSSLSEATEESFDRYVEFVSMVTGKESQEVFQALIDSVQREHDYGAYETVHNAFWSFPPNEFSQYMVSALPRHIERMGSAFEHNVGRFLCPLVGWARETYLPVFIKALHEAPEEDQTIVNDHRL